MLLNNIMKLLLLRLTFVFCFFNTINSQVQRQVDMQNTRDGENIEYCFTHKKMQALLQNQDFLTQFNIDEIAFEKCCQLTIDHTNITLGLIRYLKTKL